jgi:hypothetical protein
MEIRSTEEARENIVNFTNEYIRILMAKKELDAEMTDIKNSYKEEGVPVSIVTRVFGKIKSAKKKTETELAEEEIIQEWLESNAEIDDKIGILTAK